MTKQQYIDNIEYNENMFMDDEGYLFTSHITDIAQITADTDLSKEETTYLLKMIVGYM